MVWIMSVHCGLLGFSFSSRKVLWSDVFNIIKFIANHLISIWTLRKRWFFWRTEGRKHINNLQSSYKSLQSTLFFRGICIEKSINKLEEQCASKAKIIL